MTLGPLGRIVAVVALLGAFVATLLLVRWRRAAAPSRAVWVWSDGVMREPRARDSLVAWARRHRVDRVYQHVEPLLLEDPAAVEGFLRHLRRAGIRVEALLGDPAWLSAPDSALVRLDHLLGMHDRLGTDTLAGAHLDVEPQGLPAWATGRDSLVTAFQSLVERLRERRGTRTLPFHFDIPFWYDEVVVPGGDGGSLAAWLIPRVEGVTVMAYLTDTATLWPTLVAERALARRHGTTLRFGVETGCASRPAVSFCTAGRAPLEAMLTALHTRHRADSTWRGVAIHSYPAATALLR